MCWNTHHCDANDEQPATKADALNGSRKGTAFHSNNSKQLWVQLVLFYTTCSPRARRAASGKRDVFLVLAEPGLWQLLDEGKHVIVKGNGKGRVVCGEEETLWSTVLLGCVGLTVGVRCGVGKLFTSDVNSSPVCC